jgi:hypothetical protein
MFRCLLFAAVLATVVPLWPKEKGRSWQQGKVAAVFPSGARQPGDPPPLCPWRRETPCGWP